MDNCTIWCVRIFNWVGEGWAWTLETLTAWLGADSIFIGWEYIVGTFQVPSLPSPPTYRHHYDLLEKFSHATWPNSRLNCKSLHIYFSRCGETSRFKDKQITNTLCWNTIKETLCVFNSTLLDVVNDQLLLLCIQVFMKKDSLNKCL